MKLSGPITLPEIRQRIYRYCAYQERCHLEVKNKLYELGAARSQVDEIMADLITEGYLNEERFARAFAGGKFRMKKWGKVRIVRELERKGLTSNCIRSGMEEIPDNDYLRVLEELLVRKAGQLNEKDPFVKKDKLASYAVQKGYESELVWRVLKDKHFD